MATLTGTGGNDTLVGGSDNDLLVGFSGNDSLSGGAGNDTLSDGAGNDTLDGGEGNDLIIGGTGLDSIIGGTGSDSIRTDGTTSVTIVGFVSSVAVFEAGDWVDAGDGNDTIISAGGDIIDGGTGDDVLEFDVRYMTANQNLDMSVNATAALTSAFGGTVTGVEFFRVTLGSGNDTVLGSANADSISGGLGVDSIDAGAGDDRIIWNSGADTLIGGSGIDTLLASSGLVTAPINIDLATNADAQISTSYGITVSGFERYSLLLSSGNDTAFGSANADTLDGGVGDDYIDARDGADLIFGGLGNDALFGGEGADSLIGNDGNDALFGDHLAVLVGASLVLTIGTTLNQIDTINGLAGDDWIVSSGGDSILGGDGFDLVDLDVSGFAGAYNLDLSGPSATIAAAAFGGSYVAIEYFRYWLGSGSDTVLGGTGDDFASGGAGNDSLVGGIGDDTLISGFGIDTLLGGANNDYLVQAQALSADLTTGLVARAATAGGGLFDGGDGDDRVEIGAAGTTAIGGLGIDTLNVWATAASSLSIDLSGDANAAVSTAYGITASGFEGFDLQLTAGNDSAIGSTGDDVFRGDAGNDTLLGGAGNDVLVAGLGNDVLTGGTGSDTFSIVLSAGGNDTITDYQGGVDVIQFEGAVTSFTNNVDLDADGQADDAEILGAGRVVLLNASFGVIDGTAGNDVLAGGTGNDTIFGYGGNDSLNSGAGNNMLDGGDGDDVLQADAGNNTLIGGQGNDYFIGGAGNDSMVGGDGNDYFIIASASGSDTLTGGAGADFFNLNGINGPVTITDLQVSGLNADALFVNANYAVTNSIDLDADGQNDDALLTLTSGFDVGKIINLLNTTFGIRNGTVNPDYMVGTVNTDTLNGLDGNDTLDGSFGDDVLNGGVGNDVIIGGTGNDTVSGGDDGDRISGGVGADSLLGNSGNDLIANGELGQFQTFNAASIDFTGASDTVVDRTDAGDGDDRVIAAIGDISDGGAGNDTLEVDFVTETVARTLNLAAGTTQSVLSALNVNATNFEAYRFWLGSGSDLVVGTSDGDNIASGLGNDTIYSGAGDDTLNGGDGNDYLDGGTGADTMRGGAGDDTYIVDSMLDVIDELPIFGGTNTAYTLGSYTLKAQTNVVILAASNSASTAGLALTGNEFSNTIIAAAGSDTIIGGAGPNAFGSPGQIFTDTLYGKGGDDFYYVDKQQDVVIEVVGEGFDAIFTSSNYTLAINSEVEVLSGNLSSTVGLSLTGNNLNNQILGTSGNDILNGGVGDDTLYGYGGNDAYTVDGATDVVIEAIGGGNDTIFASVNYTLSEGVEVEALSAVNRGLSTGPGGGVILVPVPGPGGGPPIFMPIPLPPVGPPPIGPAAVPISLTGNSFANAVLGTEAGDTLNGGAGADTLTGYGGDDFYYVDNVGDVIVEAGSAGKDIVFTTSNYNLSVGSEIEVLAVSNSASTAAYNLGGNDFNNQILGAAGSDSITGGLGNDTLYGFDGGDILVGGIGNDYLFGGNGADTVIGGAGGDWLIGGAGADVFKFGTAGDSLTSAQDVITDFESGSDKLDFSGFTNAIGTPIGQPFTIGSLQAGGGPRIQIGTSAADGYYHILADFDGDGVADMELLISAVNGGSVPVAGDFIL